uniref:Pre-mRNA 3'-end-processing factor FIP1 n=1 Tax=Globodera pallida TaxID=36090 RepID=A0A183BK39_GLOPA
MSDDQEELSTAMEQSIVQIIDKGDQQKEAEAIPEKEPMDDRPAFLNDDESDEDDFVVTIGEIKTNVFQKQQRVGTVGGAAIDLDANPTLKDGSQIYDLDLATMEDKPWRKPGADITDYFNYGFNEESWNQYCERQRKFRIEFGTDQTAINKAILSNIQLTGPVQVGLQTFAGGRQLVNLVGGQESKQNKVQKIVLDLSKPPPPITDQPQSVSLISRTVISGSGIITRQESESTANSHQPASAVLLFGNSASRDDNHIPFDGFLKATSQFRPRDSAS